MAVLFQVGERAFRAVPRAHGNGSARRCSRLGARLDGLRWKGKRSGDENFTVNNCSTHPIGSTLQPLACRNQPQGILVLFGSSGGVLYDAHGEGHHGSIKARQVGQQLPIFPDHGVPPGLLPRAGCVVPKAAAGLRRRGMASSGTAVPGRILRPMPHCP